LEATTNISLTDNEFLEKIIEENKAVMARHLAIFNSPSEFMKCMVAIELWGMAMNKDAVAYAIEISKDEIESWDMKAWKPKQNNLPKVPELLVEDAQMLRLIWKSRNRAESTPRHLRETATTARKTSFENFKKILNRGRSMIADCGCLNPTLPESAIKDELTCAFKATETGPELEEARKSHNEKKVERLKEKVRQTNRKAKKNFQSSSDTNKATAIKKVTASKKLTSDKKPSSSKKTASAKKAMGAKKAASTEKTYTKKTPMPMLPKLLP